jgi:hypothetical protein
VNDWTDLRAKALAAQRQLAEGPREWPGRPSRQRLELFLAADPDTILELLAENARLREVHA